MSQSNAHHRTADPLPHPQVGLPHVLEFLDTKRHLISGLPDEERPRLYERFLEVLEAKAPDVLVKARAKASAKRKREAEVEEVDKKGGLLASWQTIEGGCAGGGGFSFGFAL